MGRKAEGWRPLTNAERQRRWRQQQQVDLKMFRAMLGKASPSRVASADDRRKLAKICGLLSSSHEGERLAAANKANQLLKKLRLTWYDILGA